MLAERGNTRVIFFALLILTLICWQKPLIGQEEPVVDLPASADEEPGDAEGQNANDGKAAEPGSWESSYQLEELNKTVAIEKIITAPGDYRYASFGKPNPFIEPVTTVRKAEPVITGIEIPIISPLQSYQLNELKVSGIWQMDDGSRKAIIMTPKNQGIIVKEKDPVSNGKIMKILPTGILVRLYKLRVDGSREFTDRTMNFGPAGVTNVTGSLVLEPGEAPRFQAADDYDVDLDGLAPEENAPDGEQQPGGIGPEDQAAPNQNANPGAGLPTPEGGGPAPQQGAGFGQQPQAGLSRGNPGLTGGTAPPPPAAPVAVPVQVPIPFPVQPPQQ